jgi:hypothetical protein
MDLVVIPNPPHKKVGLNLVWVHHPVRLASKSLAASDLRKKSVVGSDLIVAKGEQESTTRYQRIEAICGVKTNLVRGTLSPSALDKESLEVLLYKCNASKC